jgi:serine/threonine-protein kinase
MRRAVLADVARRANSIVPCGPAPAANDTERQSSARLDPLIDQVVNGRYRVKRILARGGMGRVYCATQEPFGRAVALKVVRDDDPGAGQMRPHERFLLEAEILARLQHPNIVSIFESGTMEGPFKGQSFIAMELLGGETLADRLRGGTRLPLAKVLAMALQITRGLRAAHDRGIVHRDLKPSNVMLVPDGDDEEIVKLVDFGIGKLLWDGRDERALDLTGVGAVVGTPQFMAPEQVGGQSLPAADLYSLGTIMFLALSGRLPYEAKATTELLRNKISRDAPRLRDVVPELAIPDAVDSLVSSLLARMPEPRPRAGALIRALTACAAADPSEPVPTTALEKVTSASLLPPATSSSASSRPSGIVPRARPTAPRTPIARLTPFVVGALLTYAVVLVYAFGRPRPVVLDEPLSVAAPVGASDVAAAPRHFALEKSVEVIAAARPAPVAVVPRAPAVVSTATALPAPVACPAPAAPPPVVVQEFSTER